jgi:putative endonuclease
LSPQRRPDRDRRGALQFGLRAEWLALAFLTLRGYRILARNVRAPGGEIDLIVLRGETIAFVEVKARPTLELALSTITERKRQRIARAARAWLARNGWAAGHVLRGDAVYIAPWRLPRHLPAAFALDLGL